MAYGASTGQFLVNRSSEPGRVCMPPTRARGPFGPRPGGWFIALWVDLGLPQLPNDPKSLAYLLRTVEIPDPCGQSQVGGA